MKKLYVHIGTGKTGTTAIQSTLLGSKNYLANYNVQYAVSGLNGVNHHALCFNSYAYRTGIKAKDALYIQYNNLRQEIEVSKCDNIIISSEDFPGLDECQVEEFVKYFSDVAEVHVIVYLRRQDLFLESWYAQIIKAGAVNTRIDSLQAQLEEKNILDYYSLVERWAKKLVSIKNIHVRPFERDLFYKDDIVLEFLKIMGVDSIDSGSLNRSRVDENLSITRVQIEIIKFLCGLGVNQKEVPLMLIPYDGFKGCDKVYLSSSARKDLLLKYSISNKKLANKYLGNKTDVLFSDNRIPETKDSPLQPKISFIKKVLNNEG